MSGGKYEVISVDAHGRPRRVLRQDAGTGEAWEEEWVEGHRPAIGPVSIYDPIGRMEKETSNER
jgi:hypothetical protein